MKLRPHHLLCIQKYTGKGYDAPFAANMEKIIRRLQADPGQLIRLVEGRDDVCAACPHMVDGRCASEEKVNRMDRGVLSACARSYGQADSWRALADAAGKRIFQTKKSEEICGDCQWIELCRATREGWIHGKEE